MLDINKIRQLIEMMVSNDLTEISLRDGDVEVNLRRPMPHTNETPPAVSHHPVSQNPAPAILPMPAAAVGPAPTAAETEAEVELAPITSPMVGTFYAASDPESPPFVRVGSRVEPSTVVCIIEAMKVFNEIKAEVAGVIDRILVKNQEAVEFGQTLFLVRPE